MKAELLEKLNRLVERREELEGELAQPDAAADPDQFRRLSQEYAQLEQVATSVAAYRAAEQERRNLEDMQADDDPELREMARGELPGLIKRIAEVEADLQQFLVPKDPNDDANVFLEIRAGTGGDEAAIFAGDLQRMYQRYTEARGWQLEVLSLSEGEHGGYKEIISRICGHGAYSRLKFESGAHRVQRVPETESQGRIHTSAATVAILPEIAPTAAIQINAADLKVDTYRASGAGGQHINKTDSAVRITHLPTGVVVECQDERSQHKNRARAMSLLQSRLQDAEQRKQDSERAATRKLLVGSGDRSERIRTYNFPQGRVTDHRINLTLYQLERIIQGELDDVVGPLLNEYQAEQLAHLSE